MLELVVYVAHSSSYQSSASPTRKCLMAAGKYKPRDVKYSMASCNHNLGGGRLVRFIGSQLDGFGKACPVLLADSSSGGIATALNGSTWHTAGATTFEGSVRVRLDTGLSVVTGEGNTKRVSPTCFEK